MGIASLTAPKLAADPDPTGSARSTGPLRIPSRSLLGYSPAMLFILIVVADSFRMADSDLWGHIRFGQAVVNLGHPMLRDPYSYSAAGHIWRDHEWLSEVVMALAYNALGVVGLKLMKFAATAATILLLALAAGESGADATVQLGAMVAAALALMPQFQFRPQIFTFVALAGLTAILAQDNYRRRAPLWLAIPLLAIWANFHGGFVVGVAILFTYSSFKSLQDYELGCGLRHGTSLLAVSACATAATLLNPYGIETWYAVAHSVRDPLTRVAIAEWQPFIVVVHQAWRRDPIALAHYILVIAIFIVLVLSAIRTRRSDDSALLAIAALMAGAAMISARNLALFVIVAVPPLCRHVALWPGDRQSDAHEDRSAVNPVFAVAIAMALAAYTGLFSNRLEAGSCPAGAVAFMSAHGLHGNILADYGWGTYMIWHAAADSRVFIDGRCETVYPEKVISDYLTFHFGRPGASRVLSEYGHDFVLVPVHSRAYRAVSQSTGWTLIYRDAVATLFARAGSPAASITPVITAAKPAAAFFP